MAPSFRKRRPVSSWVTVLGLAMGTVASLAAQSEELPPVSEVLHQVEDAGAALNFRARGRLVHTSGDEERKVYQLAVVQKRMAHGTSLLWTITDPPEARTRILVESRADGGASIRMAPFGKDPEVIPPGMWASPLLGTHLSIGDVADNHFAWPAQKILRREACGARQCYVVQSDAGRQVASPYVSVTSWVDQDTFLPIIVRKTPAGAGAGKEFQCRGTRRSGGHWLATKVETKIAGAAGSTTIVFTRGSVDASIRDEEVDPQTVFGDAKPR